MSYVAGLVGFLILISFIVTIHELGHYGVARLFGTKMDRFSVGLGKVLWSRRDKRGVEWALSAIPLGGYVKFSGDENLSSMSPDANALAAAKEIIEARDGVGAHKAYFHFKPIWQRFLIVLAGPMANFILAIVLFSGLLMGIGLPRIAPVVGGVKAGTPAEAAGFRKGDVIQSVDGRSVNDFTEIMQVVSLRADTPIKITFSRDHTPMTVTVTPYRDFDVIDGRKVEIGRIGINIPREYVYKHYNPIEAVVEANRMTWSFVDTNLTYIGRIFIGKENASQISGVIGMTQNAGKMTESALTSEGTLLDKSLRLVISFITYGALISVGVGVLNLLPLPVLDGGHLMFYLYEAVARKPVSAPIQELSFRIGLASLLGLMLFAAYNDISHGFFNRAEDVSKTEQVGASPQKSGTAGK
jgi:regulator of sigma E protease